MSETERLLADLRAGCMVPAGTSCRLCHGCWFSDEAERVEDHHDWCPMRASVDWHRAYLARPAEREPAASTARDMLLTMISELEQKGHIGRLGQWSATALRQYVGELAGQPQAEVEMWLMTPNADLGGLKPAAAAASRGKYDAVIHAVEMRRARLSRPTYRTLDSEAGR